MAEMPIPETPTPIAAVSPAAAATTTEDAPVPKPMFTTSRLIVRRYHPKDAPSMNLHSNDVDVKKFMTLMFTNSSTLAHTERWIALNVSDPYPANFGIFEASSPDVAIGSIGLKPGSDVNSHTAEVGYWIGKPFWGKGYTTEALEAFTKWTFESWEGKDGQRLKKLWAGVFSGNDASMRCLQKCGYTKEGIQKDQCEKNGQLLDLHLYGLAKRDWESRRTLVFNNQ